MNAVLVQKKVSWIGYLLLRPLPTLFIIVSLFFLKK